MNKKLWQSTAIVLVVYGLLTVVMTWPLAAQLGTSIPAGGVPDGGGSDFLVHLWTFWWIKTAIVEGLNPLYTNLIFYPHGVSLAYHNTAWVNIAAWLPLQAIVGSYAAYSLVFMGIILLNAWAMHLLVREWTGSSSAAFVAGLIYGFWPYTLTRSGQINLIVVCWIPFALLYLRRTIENGRKRDAVLTAIFLALTGISRWHLLIIGGIIVGLYLFYTCLTDSACRTWRSFGLLMLIGIIVIALLAPLATPIIIAQMTLPHPEDIFLDEQSFCQTDLLGYVFPNSYLALWGRVSFWFRNRVKNLYTDDRVPFLGYTTILLACYGMITNWRSARLWVLTAITLIVLALGPQLRFYNQIYSQVPMPYRLVENLFFIRIIRYSHRFNIFLGLPMAMLAALGVRTLLSRQCCRRRAGLLIGVISVLVLCEYCLIPYYTFRPGPKIPAWHKRLAQDHDRFAILDIPMAPRYYDKWYILYQTIHGKALMEGHVSRLPREALGFLKSTPFLEDLHSSNTIDPDPERGSVTQQLRPLAEANVRYIVMHKYFPRSPKMLPDWRDWLSFDPCYEDDEVVVYRTAPRLGRDFVLAHEMIQGIGLIRVNFSPGDASRSGVIYADTRWGIAAGLGGKYRASLKLVNAQGEPVQMKSKSLLSNGSGSGEATDEVLRRDYVLQMDPLLEPGEYSVIVTLTDSATDEEVGHSVLLGELTVDLRH